jgi:GTP-binding protein
MNERDPRIVEAEFSAAARRLAELPPPTGVEVAFAGRSNVGKSSLVNCLTERRNLLRVSSTPGCTRAIGFYQARVSGGAQLTLVDLPGYGYARRSKAEREEWAELIEGYLLGRPTLRAVIAIVDVRRGLESDDRDLLELVKAPPSCPRPPVSAIVVATKLDKVPASKRKLELARVQKSAGVPVVGFSSVDRTGAHELLVGMLKAAGIGS